VREKKIHNKYYEQDKLKIDDIIKLKSFGCLILIEILENLNYQEKSKFNY